MPVGGGFFGIENQFDVVRATFTDGTNVPRIPPMRIGGGIYWRDDAWLARVRLIHAFAQNDIAPVAETPTPGYDDLRAEVSYSWKTAKARSRPAKRNDVRPGRHQSAQPGHPQQRVLHQGRGADAGRVGPLFARLKY